MNEEKAIRLWKRLKISQVRFEFSCGGDSIRDTQIYIDTPKGEIENSYISDYFDNEVYRNVDFYVDSNGHYIGESGTVYITLNERDEEPFFEYYKESTSKYEEIVSATVFLELNQEECDFINNYVNLFGKNFDDSSFWNYKKDFVVTKEFEDIINRLNESLSDLAKNHDFVTDLELDINDVLAQVETPIKIKDNLIEVVLLAKGFRYENNNR